MGLLGPTPLLPYKYNRDFIVIANRSFPSNVRSNHLKNATDNCSNKMPRNLNQAEVSPISQSTIETIRPRKKVVCHPDAMGKRLNNFLQFDSCEYSNCVFQLCPDIEQRYAADVVVYAVNSNLLRSTVPAHIRQSQIWILFHLEPPSFPGNHWKPEVNNFNGTMTFMSNPSPGHFYYPYGMTLPVKLNSTAVVPNYAQGKTKGAFAYVSNCRSLNYNRLGAMRQLGKYINVDIFGGCTGMKPCPHRADADCESKLHSDYRFFLSFENSLCKDYITEKFWRPLVSDGYFIPVALGGRSVEDYTAAAPPSSFIHAYNFSSIAHLGKYLQSLMADDAAFNKYHEWRKTHKTETYTSRFAACDICKAATNPDTIRASQRTRFADEWNNPNNCRVF